MSTEVWYTVFRSILIQSTFCDQVIEYVLHATDPDLTVHRRQLIYIYSPRELDPECSGELYPSICEFVSDLITYYHIGDM